LCRRATILIILGTATAFIVAFVIYANLQVRPAPNEKIRILAGDDLIPRPIGVVNHAITIQGPRSEVWPWLIQMGSGRAGWYAYDFIDNGGHKSAELIIPQYQKISIGTVFPALPGVKDVFVVAQYEFEKSLVLSWRTPAGQYQTTWAFVLEEPQLAQTRLIVRGRVARDYHPYGLPQWAALLLARPAHFIMQRKQLLSIARRVELDQRHKQTIPH
jgi:hypothetical protein